MIETYREHHPLLDSLSDEELRPRPYSPQYHRRFRSTTSGRARNNIKGAAAIFARWPDHWTSSLTYWWLAVGMIMLTIFIIYNTVSAFSLLPQDNQMKNPKPYIKSSNALHVALPDIYMHVFADCKEEVDLNKFVPYIEVIARKYVNFKYNLYIILNDTSIDNAALSAEENNEIALNSLWLKKSSDMKQYMRGDNLYIKYIALSQYMNNSPLQRFWRSIPSQFTEFLVRAVSIWERGGIAFNPLILTPQSPHAIYIEKLNAILQSYGKKTISDVGSKRRKEIIKKHRLKKQNKTIEPKVNNIRDIINALEIEYDMSSSPHNLDEAETKDVLELSVTPNKFQFATVPTNQSNLQLEHETRSTQSPVPVNNSKVITITNYSKELLDNEKSTKNSLLPIFLEFLFKDKSKNNTLALKPSILTTSARKRRSPVIMDESERVTNKFKKYKPMIITTKSVQESNETNEYAPLINKFDNMSNQLTIDLKGNLISTETACHAFIGTIFSDAVHHTDDETIKDFIISELSIFCKGLLSTCKGIDVILI